MTEEDMLAELEQISPIAETDPKESGTLAKLEQELAQDYEALGIGKAKPQTETTESEKLELMEIEVGGALNHYEENPTTETLGAALDVLTSLFEATTNSDPFTTSHKSQISKVTALIEKIGSQLGHFDDKKHSLDSLVRLLHKQLQKYVETVVAILNTSDGGDEQEEPATPRRSLRLRKGLFGKPKTPLKKTPLKKPLLRGETPQVPKVKTKVTEESAPNIDPVVEDRIARGFTKWVLRVARKPKSLKTFQNMGKRSLQDFSKWMKKLYTNNYMVKREAEHADLTNLIPFEKLFPIDFVQQLKLTTGIPFTADQIRQGVKTLFPKPKRKKRRRMGDPADDDEEEDYSPEEDEPREKPKPKPKPEKRERVSKGGGKVSKLTLQKEQVIEVMKVLAATDPGKKFKVDPIVKAVKDNGYDISKRMVQHALKTLSEENQLSKERGGGRGGANVFWFPTAESGAKPPEMPKPEAKKQFVPSAKAKKLMETPWGPEFHDNMSLRERNDAIHMWSENEEKIFGDTYHGHGLPGSYIQKRVANWAKWQERAVQAKEAFDKDIAEQQRAYDAKHKQGRKPKFHLRTPQERMRMQTNDENIRVANNRFKKLMTAKPKDDREAFAQLNQLKSIRGQVYSNVEKKDPQWTSKFYDVDDTRGFKLVTKILATYTRMFKDENLSLRSNLQTLMERYNALPQQDRKFMSTLGMTVRGEAVVANLEKTSLINIDLTPSVPHFFSLFERDTGVSKFAAPARPKPKIKTGADVGMSIMQELHTRFLDVRLPHTEQEIPILVGRMITLITDELLKVGVLEEIDENNLFKAYEAIVGRDLVADLKIQARLHDYNKGSSAYKPLLEALTSMKDPESASPPSSPRPHTPTPDDPLSRIAESLRQEKIRKTPKKDPPPPPPQQQRPAPPTFPGAEMAVDEPDEAPARPDVNVSDAGTKSRDSSAAPSRRSRQPSRAASSQGAEQSVPSDGFGVRLTGITDEDESRDESFNFQVGGYDLSGGISHHVTDEKAPESVSQDSAVIEREQIAITKFLDSFAGPATGRSDVQKLFDTGEWRNFYTYNDHLGRLQQIRNFSTVVRPIPLRPIRRQRRGRGRVKFHEEARLRYHPESHMKKKAIEVAKQYDDFRRVAEHAQQAQVGEYISLNILPAMLYITIRKNVQISALKILCRQLIKHFQGASTRILLKQSLRTGKFSYQVWLASSVVEQLDENSLLMRFLNASNSRKKTLQIIVRQNIARGKIQELWDQKHSLL